MKSLFISVLTALFLSLAVTACFKSDVISRDFQVPAMKTPECAAVLQDAISQVEGVVSSRPYVESRTITVTYNSRTAAGMNIELTISRAGFDVDDRPADAAAKSKLPKSCQ